MLRCTRARPETPSDRRPDPDGLTADARTARREEQRTPETVARARTGALRSVLWLSPRMKPGAPTASHYDEQRVRAPSAQAVQSGDDPLDVATRQDASSALVYDLAGREEVVVGDRRLAVLTVRECFAEVPCGAHLAFGISSLNRTRKASSLEPAQCCARGALD